MATETISVWNPATEEHITDVRSFTANDVSDVIGAAVTAQRKWMKLPMAQRQQFLNDVADTVLVHRDELARLESTDVGKPLHAATAEVEGVAACFRYYAGALDKVHGDAITLDDGISLTFHEPIGVIGVITPWNFPLPIASWNIAPALAAGNAVIVKPASMTPLSTTRLGELIAGISPVMGLFQVVTGAGSTAGSALIDDPRVGKISFTGSTEVGQSILRSSATTMKRVTLELGGKSANLVFEDADVKAAAQAARGRSSIIPARTAAHAAASWSSARSLTNSSASSSRQLAR